MKARILYLCLFCGLVVTDQRITCNSCLERASDTCESEEPVTCPNSIQCATVSGFIQEGDVMTRFLYKGCPFNIPDKSWLCISVKNFYMQSYFDYCSGEKCNTGYYMPEDNEPGNGLSCETCYKEGTLEGCTSNNTMNCRGDETLCVNYRGVLERADKSLHRVSFKGCANPLALLDISFFYGFSKVQEIEFSKEDAN